MPLSHGSMVAALVFGAGAICMGATGTGASCTGIFISSSDSANCTGSRSVMDASAGASIFLRQRRFEIGAAFEFGIEPVDELENGLLLLSDVSEIPFEGEEGDGFEADGACAGKRELSRFGVATNGSPVEFNPVTAGIILTFIPRHFSERLRAFWLAKGSSLPPHFSFHLSEHLHSQILF